MPFHVLMLSLSHPRNPENQLHMSQALVLFYALKVPKILAVVLNYLCLLVSLSYTNKVQIPLKAVILINLRCGGISVVSITPHCCKDPLGDLQGICSQSLR